MSVGTVGTASGDDGARLGVTARRAHGTPPLGITALARWVWREFGVGVRDVDQWPDGSLAACWPASLDAAGLPSPAAGMVGRIFYRAQAPFVREAICRELGRLLLAGWGERPGADSAAEDFACCLLVRLGDLAAALRAGDWPDGWVRAQRASPDLALRRLDLLDRWIDQADDGDAADLLATLGRLPLRIAG